MGARVSDPSPQPSAPSLGEEPGFPFCSLIMTDSHRQVWPSRHTQALEQGEPGLQAASWLGGLGQVTWSLSPRFPLCKVGSQYPLHRVEAPKSPRVHTQGVGIPRKVYC